MLDSWQRATACRIVIVAKHCILVSCGDLGKRYQASTSWFLACERRECTWTPTAKALRSRQNRAHSSSVFGTRASRRSTLCPVCVTWRNAHSFRYMYMQALVSSFGVSFGVTFELNPRSRACPSALRCYPSAVHEVNSQPVSQNASGAALSQLTLFARIEQLASAFVLADLLCPAAELRCHALFMSTSPVHSDARLVPLVMHACQEIVSLGATCLIPGSVAELRTEGCAFARSPVACSLAGRELLQHGK